MYRELTCTVHSFQLSSAVPLTDTPSSSAPGSNCRTALACGPEVPKRPPCTTLVCDETLRQTGPQLPDAHLPASVAVRDEVSLVSSGVTLPCSPDSPSNFPDPSSPPGLKEKEGQKDKSSLHRGAIHAEHKPGLTSDTSAAQGQGKGEISVRATLWCPGRWKVVTASTGRYKRVQAISVSFTTTRIRPLSSQALLSLVSRRVLSGIWARRFAQFGSAQKRQRLVRPSRCHSGH